jgi:hypothetical protein
VRRGERRGCTRPLSTGNALLLHQVLFGNDPVFFRKGSCTTTPSGLSPAFSALGTRDCIFYALDFYWVRFNPRVAQSDSIQGRVTLRVSCSLRHLFCRNGFQPSQESALQQRNLSPTPSELGTHLYLQALRTVQPYFLVAEMPNLVSRDRATRFPARLGVTVRPIQRRRDHSLTDTVHHGTDNSPRCTLGHRGRKQLTSRFWGIGIDNASIRVLGQRERFCLIRESGQRDRSLLKSHIGASGSIMPQYAKRGIGTVFSSFANWVNGADLYSSPLWVFGSLSTPICLCD